MRFFSGSRTENKKKGLASQLYRKKLTGKEEPELTPQEKYRKALDAKINALMYEVKKDKKKSFKLPGTKDDDDKKEPSRHFREMLEKLAQKKLQKETDRHKRKVRAFEKKKRFEKKAKIALEKEQVARKLEADKQTSSSLMGTYWFGSTPDDKK